MKSIGRHLLALALIIILFLVTAPNALAATDRGPKEKVTLIHYKDGTVKPGGGSGGGKAQAYTFLAKGVRWKASPVDYVINPVNEDGLDSDFIAAALSGGAEEWDAYTSVDLFGSFTLDNAATYDADAPDERNEMVFGALTDTRIIAVTTIWGYFGGAVETREIVETDILFNNYYAWGDADINPAVMDLRNIATHEIGHVAGLGDLYRTNTAEETMYGYSTQGETKKRNLNAGDIAGIAALYGN